MQFILTANLGSKISNTVIGSVDSDSRLLAFGSGVPINGDL